MLKHKVYFLKLPTLAGCHQEFQCAMHTEPSLIQQNATILSRLCNALRPFFTLVRCYQEVKIVLCSQDLLYQKVATRRSSVLCRHTLLECALCKVPALLQEDATRRSEVYYMHRIFFTLAGCHYEGLSVLCAQDLLYSSRMLLGGLECPMHTDPSLSQQGDNRRSIVCYFAQDLFFSSRMLLGGLECAMFTEPYLLQQDATRRSQVCYMYRIFFTLAECQYEVLSVLYSHDLLYSRVCYAHRLFFTLAGWYQSNVCYFAQDLPYSSRMPL